MTFADHLPILPVAIPALAAPMTLLLMRRYPGAGLAVAFAGLIGRLGPSQYGYLANTALYWHFVDLVWIIIFPLLYLV